MNLIRSLKSKSYDVNIVCNDKDKKVMRDALKDVDHVHFLLPFKLSQYAVKYCKKNNISTTASFHAQAENVISHLGLKNADFFSKWIYKYFNSKLYKHVDGIHYPAKLNKPIFVLTNCYQKRKFSKKPKILTFVDGPFYPNTSLNENEAEKILREIAYNTMCNRTKEYSTYEYVKYIKIEE